MNFLPSTINVAIEQGIEALLQLDPDTRARLDELEGRVIAVNIVPPEIQIVLSIVERRIHLLGHLDTPADTTFTGSLSAFRSLSDGNNVLYKGDVTVEGDLHLGQQLKDIVTRLDPDWEEFLSLILGDMVAHQIALGGQSFSSWLSRTRLSLEQNTSDYLQEEAELLAPNSEVRCFCLDVDCLRASADRLEARLKRLERLAATATGENAC